MILSVGNGVEASGELRGKGVRPSGEASVMKISLRELYQLPVERSNQLFDGTAAVFSEGLQVRLRVAMVLMNIGVKVQVEQRRVLQEVLPKEICFRAVLPVIFAKIPVKIDAISGQTALFGVAVRILHGHDVNVVVPPQRR